MSVNSANGAAFPTQVSGKNKILNGDFGIWQRGTSFTNLASEAYGADRWTCNGDGSGATKVHSQQAFTPGSAPVAGYESAYFLRFAQTVAGTGATYNNPFKQKIEDVRTLAGQTVTVSFWAKADAARTLTPNFQQMFGTGGSSGVFVVGTSVSLTTSWSRYSMTFAIPSIAGKTVGANSFLELYFSAANNTAQTIDIWGVQVEAGSVATPFMTATGNPASELAACQRYYYRIGGDAAYQAIANGFAKSTTQGEINISCPTTMRIPASSVDYSTIAFYDGTTITAINSVVINSGQTGRQIANIVLGVASGLTALRPYNIICNNSTSGYLAISAEL